jgi:hypothetical protein
MSEFQKTIYRARMFDVDGRGQIILACRCILESKGNERAFSQPFVSAVLSTACSEEFADHGLALVEAFDQIHLCEILEAMQSLEYFEFSDVPRVLSQIVRNKLRRILIPSQPEPIGKDERRAALQKAREEERQAVKSMKRRLVEQRIELGRKLAALRDVTPDNKRFGRAVREQFNLHDTLLVAEMMRVARRCGDRPEMLGVGWRVLVELVSWLTPQAARRKFEAKIVSGGCVTGAEIIRTRSDRSRRIAR